MVFFSTTHSSYSLPIFAEVRFGFRMIAQISSMQVDMCMASVVDMIVNMFMTRSANTLVAATVLSDLLCTTRA